MINDHDSDGDAEHVWENFLHFIQGHGSCFLNNSHIYESPL